MDHTELLSFDAGSRGIVDVVDGCVLSSLPCDPIPFLPAPVRCRWSSSSWRRLYDDFVYWLIVDFRSWSCYGLLVEYNIPSTLDQIRYWFPAPYPSNIPLSERLSNLICFFWNVDPRSPQNCDGRLKWRRNTGRVLGIRWTEIWQNWLPVRLNPWLFSRRFHHMPMTAPHSVCIADILCRAQLAYKQRSFEARAPGRVPVAYLH
jgi:hypothetical protein